ncbi:hypothetical protein HALLA_07620 [Halostagnicola larsenii XH-48]|uniref:Uncharacterized protein n=1 Tax=Halostagnicola larsenii XH-48 TaxID=797299 RepID=W0JUU2_9EURY|nr:hypothetical protein HALLA_07620 [Halostagnicola larsenii XH-48]
MSGDAKLDRTDADARLSQGQIEKRGSRTGRPC